MLTKERNIDARAKHRLVASHTHVDCGSHMPKPGLNLQLWAYALTGNWTCSLPVTGWQLTEPPWPGQTVEVLKTRAKHQTVWKINAKAFASMHTKWNLGFQAPFILETCSRSNLFKNQISSVTKEPRDSHTCIMCVSCWYMYRHERVVRESRPEVLLDNWDIFPWTYLVENWIIWELSCSRTQSDCLLCGGDMPLDHSVNFTGVESSKAPC